MRKKILTRMKWKGWLCPSLQAVQIQCLARIWIGILAFTLNASSLHCDPLDALQKYVVSKFLAWETMQEAQLASYRSTRKYVLNATQRKEFLTADVLMNYSSARGETLDITGWTGSSGVYRLALRKILESEASFTRPQNKSQLRLSEDNYSFELLGKEQREGWLCYVLRIKPRRRSKYLLEGRIWIDAENYGLVRLDGQVTVGSFWVGRPYVVQDLQYVDGFWILRNSKWSTRARCVGDVALSIETSSYQLPQPTARSLRAP